MLEVQPMPHPVTASVVLDGRERHFEDIQNFKRIFQNFIVCRNLCEINIKREEELSLAVVVGYGLAVVFQRVFEASGHACRAIAESEV